MATKIGVVGCGGRMGQALLKIINEHNDAILAGGTERHDSPLIGTALMPNLAGYEDLLIHDNPELLFEQCDVVIDFTCPTATVLHLDYAKKYQTAHIIGTTGLSEEQEALIADTAKDIPLVYASNYSLSMNVMFCLTRQAASILDEDFDLEILEMHHRHKVDAPSGTALSLGKEAARGRNVDLNAVSDRVRDGITGERQRGDIGFAVLRGGNVAGEHTVSFNADNERFELTHKATDRSIFARGAVHAALWVTQQQNGQYDMFDVLNLPK